MTVDSLTPERVPPKRIAVHGRPIRFRWVQQAAWSFLAANAGALVISALYYIFVQLRWHVGGYQIMYLKPDWDHLFPWQGWAADRHAIRDVYEALLATLFVKSLLAQSWRKGRKPAPGWYVAISPLLIAVTALPVVAAGVALIDHVFPWTWHQLFTRHVIRNPAHLPHAASWLATYLSGYPWQPIVIGIIAGLVVHRVYAPAGNTVQLYFVGRAVDKTRDAISAGDPYPYRHLPRWPMPPVVRERAAWIMEADLAVPDRTGSIAWAVWTSTLILAALTGYGAYIRYVVAKGH